MIKRNCLNQLQAALYKELAEHYTVYDGWPCAEGITFPYFILGRNNVLQEGTKTWHGDEVVCVLHAFSAYDGCKEVNDMGDLALQVLSNTDLVMNDFVIESSVSSSWEILEENIPDQTTVKHGVLKHVFKIRQKGGQL